MAISYKKLEVSELMIKYLINPVNKKSKISKEIYGHFSEHLGRCIYGGIFVRDEDGIPNTNGMRNDVVKALKNIRVPVLRWPGGCFADDYHWKDGIGPVESRKKMVNTSWGGVVEDNSFGTHEFMELCRQLECEPYINVNVGSGTVAEMEEWIEYMTFDGTSPMAELRRKNGHEKAWKVKFVGIGNENWGCGGNMRPEYYSDEYRKYQTFVKNYGDNKVYKIACGANDVDPAWSSVLMRESAKFLDALSFHYYTVPGGFDNKGPATGFDEKTYYKTLNLALKMDGFMTVQSGIMNLYDPEKRVALIVDEWGGWYAVEPGTNPGFLYQQNTMRDALIAGTTLNIFNKHSDRVRMANIAQMVNVLQSVILTEGPKMLLTPTYHVFDLYKDHQDATLIDSFIDADQIGEGEFAVPNLQESASIDKDGKITSTICNISASESYDIELTVFDKNIKTVSARIVTNKFDAFNTFENPSNVAVEKFEDLAVKNGKLLFKMPACSVASIQLS